MNPKILGIGPGFLNQVPTLGVGLGFKGLVPKTCHMSLSSISLRLSDASASLPSPSLCPAMYAKLPECASIYMYLCTHARVFAFAYVYSMHVSSCSAPSRRHEQPEHPRADVFSLSLSLSLALHAVAATFYFIHRTLGPRHSCFQLLGFFLPLPSAEGPPKST